MSTTHRTNTESELLAVALALGAREVSGWSTAESRITDGLPTIQHSQVEHLERQIRRGRDPLGDRFCRLRSPSERRQLGATYTPARIINAMTRAVAQKGEPDRVVDPGAGSARFLVRAGRHFPRAALVGIELDPVAAVIARANLAVAGLGDRARLVLGDYRAARLPAIEGRTAYIGNPPYVRHHLIEARWKEWLTAEATKRGLHRSQLAGLHVHFFLATVIAARAGDLGCFITASEWLDVNYGQLVRDLFVGELGGESITLVEPTARPFPDAATTAAITTFVLHAQPRSVRLRRVASVSRLGSLAGGHRVRRERLEVERRWSHLVRARRKIPEGFIELGELCRVHRGQVTGANRVWIEGTHSEDLPERVLFPAVTRARELFQAGQELTNAAPLRRVIDLPPELDDLTTEERAAVERFLSYAKKAGAHTSYIARNRRAWWSVGLRVAAPILATYMARRPPAFVLNSAEARHINIAHGLYPREPLNEEILRALVDHLATATDTRDGRTYAGGLTKFEPREMERIPVPTPQVLAHGLT